LAPEWTEPELAAASRHSERDTMVVAAGDCADCADCAGDVALVALLEVGAVAVAWDAASDAAGTVLGAFTGGVEPLASDAEFESCHGLVTPTTTATAAKPEARISPAFPKERLGGAKSGAASAGPKPGTGGSTAVSVSFLGSSGVTAFHARAARSCSWKAVGSGAVSAASGEGVS